VRIVKAVVRNQQIVKDFSPYERSRDNPRNVVKADLAVPDPLRINHYSGTMFALIEATRVVGASSNCEPCFSDLRLEGVF
jgi:hypothetical protein